MWPIKNLNKDLGKKLIIKYDPSRKVNNEVQYDTNLKEFVMRADNRLPFPKLIPYVLHLSTIQSGHSSAFVD